MGGLFSRKVRRTSKEILEALEKEIKGKSRSRRKNQLYERSFISYLLLVSFVIYLVGVALLYLYLRPSTWGEWLVYVVPLLLFPLVVYLVKKLLNWYFAHRKAQFDQELAGLQEEKRKVLNEVMEKETYKTAKELLEKYDPTHPSLQSHTPRPSAENASSGGQLRRRATGGSTPVHPSQLRSPPPSQHPPPLLTPQLPHTTSSSSSSAVSSSTTSHITPATPTSRVSNVGVASNGLDEGKQQLIPPGMCLGAPPGPPTPCPILPRQRSNVDKVVEYLVGDGPNNRYALVCRKCYSHNGMALRDEFEYLTFRCAYCYHLNRAPKTKPTLRPPGGGSGMGMSSGAMEEKHVEAGTESSGGNTTEEMSPPSPQQPPVTATVTTDNGDSVAPDTRDSLEAAAD